MGKTSKPERPIADSMNAAYRKHERRWKDNRFVYAVVSRRSRGISIGVNLNPGKECCFKCIYCQVDRRVLPADRAVDLDCVTRELDTILEADRSGSLYSEPPFDLLPLEGRGVRDIAFSGDGEPTAVPFFSKAVRIAVDARRQFGLCDAKIVLITNAAYLDKPHVAASLSLMDENNGEIWAKLDAGTDEYYRKINRSGISFEKILNNILKAASIRPIVIQTLWMKLQDAAPSESEIEAYCNRLKSLLLSGGRLSGVQLYTIARTPSEQSVSALSDTELNRIADTIRARVPVPVAVFYGIGGRSGEGG